MRVLHTADWHVGKKLGRIDRLPETEAVLDELVAVAKDAEADLVIVAGDLFDRGLPPFLSLKLVLETLVRLADTGARVVGIPGNHDSADLFEVLAPHLLHSGVTLVHKALRPDAGGIVTIPSRDGGETARVACFPFLHEAQVVDFLEMPGEEAFKSYADRVRAVCRAYADAMVRSGGGKTVDILAGHFMIHGAVPSGSERELHIGEAYMAREGSVPPEVHYGALGHIHRAQVAPGSDHARYAGSLIQLDFGEAGQDKSVVVVELTASGRRNIEEVPITSGRRLMRVRDALEDLRARAAELQGAILDVQVVTEGPQPGLADEVRGFLPDALYVRADYPREESAPRDREGMTLLDLYGEFVVQRRGAPPDEELAEAFRELCDQAGVEL